VLVTDRTVGRLYANRVARSLRDAGYAVSVDVLPAGEAAKSTREVARLCSKWARRSVDRGSIVVALGGGALSDAAGFAAATYARGLKWAILPTTLLAQADAAIGGKVAVNLPEGKNLVGAYHHPIAVLGDTEALRTLPLREFRAGLAEIVKMGVISRRDLLGRVARFAARGLRTADPGLAGLLRVAAGEKARVVSSDERDQGARLALNFGHTVGHALEAAFGPRAYRHGEAVSVGMVVALRLSVLEAGLDPIAAVGVQGILRALGLPTTMSRKPGARFWSALGRDKKRGRRAIRVVLCPEIGTSKVFELTSLTTLRRVVRSSVRSP
jgi:3-dehydroquinate synthase